MSRYACVRPRVRLTCEGAKEGRPGVYRVHRESVLYEELLTMLTIFLGTAVPALIAGRPGVHRDFLCPTWGPFEPLLAQGLWRAPASRLELVPGSSRA
jgi:hypothetical protein